jgi:hypothetical protein
MRSPNSHTELETSLLQSLDFQFGPFHDLDRVTQAQFQPFGDYLIGVRADGVCRVTVDGKTIAREFRTHGVEAKVGRVHLDKGQKAALSVNYGNMGGGKPRAQLI